MNMTDDKDGIKGDNKVEEHLASCPECSRKAAKLDQMITSLENHKDLFCPEIWQLHDFVRFGDDPSASVARHIKRCAPCAQKVEELRTGTDTQPSMPPALFRALKEKYPPRPSLWTTIKDFLSESFRLPILTVATAAAVVLIVVVLYPREGPKPLIALSTVSWRGSFSLMAPGLSPGTTKKPRVAMVIVLKGFKPGLTQDQIDDLYQALKPNKAIKEKYTFISPDEVSEAIGKERDAGDTKKLAGKLYQDLNVSKLIVITLQPDGTAVKLVVAITDARSGEIGKEQTAQAVPLTEVPGTLKHMTSMLLGSEDR